MRSEEVIERTALYVRDELYAESSGHDWWHIDRVRGLAMMIARRESADPYVTELAALLHDISDYKLNGGDLERGPQIAFDWLRQLSVSKECATAVSDIVANISFKGAGVACSMPTIEGMVVQDADRLDALGAIGVARAFAYGGFAGQPMHDPTLPPRLHETHEEYLNRKGTTVNHFYEKLLLLKDRMNTDSGRRIAERRHAVLADFLREFLAEWDGRDVDRD